MNSEPTQHERAAREIVTLIPWKRWSDSDENVSSVAHILRKHFPAPSAQPTDKPGAVQEGPTKPGWYECQHRQDSKQMRVARWWNGESLHFSTHGKTTSVFHYTDFIPLASLVPGDEDLRAFAERILRGEYGPAACELPILAQQPDPIQAVCKRIDGELRSAARRALAARPQPEEPRR